MRREPGRSLPQTVLRLVARLVPLATRQEWTDEWAAELHELERLRRAGGRADVPGPWRFVIGALPHALWHMKEDWSMDTLIQDLRFATRTLRRSPGFTVVAVLTLALGIGANGMILSLVNGLVLRAPAGVEAPDRLVQIARSYDEAPRWDNWSWPALRLIQEASTTFEDVAGYTGRSLILGEGVDAEQAPGLFVTGNYFEVLGTRPLAGRLIGPSDGTTPGAHPVVVLSHTTWQQRFGGDPTVVGSTLAVGGNPYEIIGVLPASFAGVDALGNAPAAFVPAVMTPAFRGQLPFEDWGWSWIQVVGRLSNDVSIETARAEMEVVTARLRAAPDQSEDVRVLLAEGVGLSPEERAEAERISVLLLGVAALVLLLTCANVASLFVARASTRRAEMGVRLALGAGRSRLSRQLVTESVVLGLGAAVVAGVLLLLSARLLPALMPYTMAVSVAPDARILTALAALGVLSGILFGAIPAVSAARRDLAGTLRQSGTTGTTSRTRLRDGLVVVQLSISLALLSGAALLGGSLFKASTADPGFEPEGVLVATMDLEATGRYDAGAASRFAEALSLQVRALPGVVSASAATRAPFVGGFASSSRAPAEREDEEGANIEAETAFVGSDYFVTLEIPLLEGRPLGPASTESESVAVVDESLAQLFWPGQSAVGQMLGGSTPARVVGVVGDVQIRSLRSPARAGVYLPLDQAFTQRIMLHVRTSVPPLELSRPVRAAVAALDPGVPVAATLDLHGRMASSLGTTLTFARLVSLFAALALLLSVVGLYGLVAFGVTQRVREMGIRKALGARPGSLSRLVLAHALALTTVGTLVGLILAVALGRALEDVLFGVSSTDPRLLVAASVLLMTSAAVAAWLPARRAGLVDAATSLRE